MVDMIKRIAIQDEITEENVICQVATKILYHQSSKRKVSQIFQKLGENSENFMAEFKYTVPTNLAIQAKIKLKLSKIKYETLRDYLGDYISLPSYSTLASYIKPKMPILEDPEDFKFNNEVVGKYWPPLKVAQDAIEDILENHHGENPERVPQELYVSGGIGGDGFSDCCDRMGKDIDKNTSSRYFIGLRISRLRGKKNSENEAIEYYVETSQSYVTVKPILIAEFKENRESLDYTWSWIQDKWATEMKEFKVTFRSRVITIHFLKPKFIGDGKGYFMLLNVLRAYCYLCTID